MRSFICGIVTLCMFSNVAMADCDFSKGVTPLSGGGYAYTEVCHREVGKLVQDNKTKDVQIDDYKKAIELKDLAITKSDQRALLWMDSADKSQERLVNIAATQKRNDFLYFGLGVVAAIGTGFMAAKLLQR